MMDIPQYCPKYLKYCPKISFKKYEFFLLIVRFEVKKFFVSNETSL